MGLILGFFAPGVLVFGSFVWLAYMLFTFDGKPAAKRLALFVAPAALLVIGVIMIVATLLRSDW